MNRNGLRGLLFCPAGAFPVALGFILVTQPCGLASLSPTGLVCAMLREVAEAAYFLASAGGVLAVIGVWQTGLWRKRILSEGAGLIIAVSTAVSTLGFLASNILPWVSSTSAEIGLFPGMVGGALLTGGVLKISVGQKRLSTERSTATVLKRLRWSRREWVVCAILTGILVAATIVSISVYSQTPSCGEGGLVEPCPAKEALVVESYRLNSPTNIP